MKGGKAIVAYGNYRRKLYKKTVEGKANTPFSDITTSERGKGTINRSFMQIILVRVGLLVDEVAMMQISFSVLRFYSVGIILLMLYTQNLNPNTTLENCALL